MPRSRGSVAECRFPATATHARVWFVSESCQPTAITSLAFDAFDLSPPRGPHHHIPVPTVHHRRFPLADEEEEEAGEEEMPALNLPLPFASLPPKTGLPFASLPKTGPKPGLPKSGLPKTGLPLPLGSS